MIRLDVGNEELCNGHETLRRTGVDKNMKELDAYRSEFSFYSKSSLFTDPKHKASNLRDVNSGWMQKAGVWK